MAEKLPTTNPPARFQKAKPIGTVRLPAPFPDGVDPDDCYAMQLIGDCMEPLVTEGVRIVAVSGLHPSNGDFAVIFIKGVDQPLFKRMVMVPPAEMMKVAPGSEVTPLIIAEQINPPGHYRFDVDRIEALHRVIGFAPAGDDVAVAVEQFIAEAA